MPYKEKCFINPLKACFTDIVHDKVIKGGKSQKRPDGLITFETYSIVIEIDENEHSSYSQEQETDRVHTIYNDLRQKPLVVIRLNPDWYVSNDTFRRGCFTYNRRVIQTEFNRRYKKLVRTIRSYIDQPPHIRHGSKDITVVYLFYSRPYPRRLGFARLTTPPSLTIPQLLDEYHDIAKYLQGLPNWEGDLTLLGACGATYRE